MQESKSLHYVLGVALALIAVFVVVALVMINSQASDTNTVVTIDNVDPTVESIYLSDYAEPGDGTQLTDDYGGGTINSLVAGSTKSVYLTGIVQDNNGAADISGVSAILFRTAQTSSCTADKNDCYQDSTCETYAGPNFDQLYYSCGPYVLQYFVDSTSTGGAYLSDNWTGRVAVTDGGTPVASTITKEMQTLLSLSIPTSINYGTLALGASTTMANDQEMVITQYGNDEADVEVSSSAAMSCSVHGDIPVSFQEWSLTSVDHSTTGTDLSGSATDTNTNISYRISDDTALTGSLFWGISIPPSGIEGTCTGATVVTAIAH